jgi:hypothetical protein
LLRLLSAQRQPSTETRFNRSHTVRRSRDRDRNRDRDRDRDRNRNRNRSRNRSRSRARARARAARLWLLALLFACSRPTMTLSVCDPTNCAGCCLRGVCMTGVSAAACGLNGISCISCGPLADCVFGVCTARDTDAGAPDAGLPDAGEDAGPPPDAGEHVGDGGYPAPHPPLLQEVFRGGPILSSPRFMAITFANDDPAFVAVADDLVATLGATSFWADTTAEYGVGAPAVATAMHSSEMPAGLLTDDDVRAWLLSHVGPADGSTVYVLFYPAGVTVDLGPGNASCDRVLAYHELIPSDAGGPDVVYAVVPRCFGARANLSDVEVLTSSAAHELIEATVDPDPHHPGWLGADDAHTAWNMLLFGEVSDLCAFDTDAYFKPAGYPYVVQRSWSNAAALGGYGCAPAAEPYFGVVPVQDDSVSYRWFGTPGLTKGLRIPNGGTGTLKLVVFSEGPTAPITVTGFSVPDMSALNLTFLETSGVNGDVLHVTVQHLYDDPSFGGVPFLITATLGSRVHYAFGFVGD